MTFRVIEGGKHKRAFGSGFKILKNRDGSYSVRKTLLGIVVGIVMTLTIVS